MVANPDSAVPGRPVKLTREWEPKLRERACGVAAVGVCDGPKLAGETLFTGEFPSEAPAGVGVAMASLLENSSVSALPLLSSAFFLFLKPCLMNEAPLATPPPTIPTPLIGAP